MSINGIINFEHRNTGMPLLRATLGLAAMCLLIAIDIAPVFAQPFRPWCVVYSGRGGRNCGFSSYEQCRMTATPGSGGSCVRNPWYVWYGPNGTAGRGGRARR